MLQQTFDALVNKCNTFTQTLENLFEKLDEAQTLNYMRHQNNIEYTEVIVNVNREEVVDYTHDDLRQVVKLMAEPITTITNLVSTKTSAEFYTTKAKIEREVFHYAMWCMISRETLAIRTPIQKVIRHDILHFQNFPPDKANFLAFARFITRSKAATAAAIAAIVATATTTAK